MPVGLRDAVLDLLLGACCVGCAAPGRMLCPGAVRSTCPRWPMRHDRAPCPPGLAPAFAGSGYDGVVRALVLGHKEQGLFALRRHWPVCWRPRCVALAPLGPVVLVPVPSRPSSVRVSRPRPHLGDDGPRLGRAGSRWLGRSGGPAVASSGGSRGPGRPGCCRPRCQSGGLVVVPVGCRPAVGPQAASSVRRGVRRRADHRRDGARGPASPDGGGPPGRGDRGGGCNRSAPNARGARPRSGRAPGGRRSQRFFGRTLSRNPSTH